MFRNRHSRGFSFLEAVISVAIMLVVVISSYQAFLMVQKAVAHSRYQMVASDLANEYFETIKNLPYEDVGTVGGVPNGVLPASQVVNRGNMEYSVVITVENINDPFDGTVEAFPNDYKLVELFVSCENCANFNPVVITGQVAPANLESS